MLGLEQRFLGCKTEVDFVSGPVSVSAQII